MVGAGGEVIGRQPVRIAALVSAIVFLGMWLAVFYMGAPGMAGASQPQDSGLGKLDSKDPIPYYIADGRGKAGYRSSDQELALWALQAWQKAAGTSIAFVSSGESKALVRIYWASPDDNDFGETVPLQINGRRGAAVYVRPDIDALGPELSALARKDDLMRESIVYLTCLHELGHALGLEHTKDFNDIMYYFGYGGDIPAYFGRYRERLHVRSDIAKVSGLSDGDVSRIRAMYAGEQVMVPGNRGSIRGSQAGE